MPSRLTVELIGLEAQRANGLAEFSSFMRGFMHDHGMRVVDKFHGGTPDVTLCVTYPGNIVWAHGRRKVCYSMFECSDIPSKWVGSLKGFDRVVVPCHWNRFIYGTHGIDAEIVPHGYDDRTFRYIPRVDDGVFTFLSYESCTVRKGTAELLKAFDAEFSSGEPVRLMLKTTEGSKGHPPDIGVHSNVQLIDAVYSPQQMADLLGEADCFVYPSMGEAWGVPPLEAMATGIPVITNKHGGLLDYWSDTCMVQVRHHVVPNCYWHLANEGLSDEATMVRSDVDDLRKRMRGVYNRRSAWMGEAEQIAEYPKRWTLERTAQRLVDIVKEEAER